MPPPGRSILVVEDDPSITMGLELNLKAEGFDVFLAHDGKRAWPRRARRISTS